MKIKIINDMNKVLKQNKGLYKKISEGKNVKKQEKILYFTPKTFYSTFTPERIRLIQLLRENKNRNISEVAKIIKRPFESVHRDIKFLEGIGLINIEKRERYRFPTAARGVNFTI